MRSPLPLARPNYDPLGRRKGTIDPEGGEAYYEFDEVGSVTDSFVNLDAVTCEGGARHP